MPIMSPSLITPPDREVRNVAVEEKETDHSLKDARVMPMNAMLSFIGGNTWSVDYYSQVLGAKEEASPYEPTQLAAYQQYHLIKNFEIKLQGSLSSDEDTEMNTMSFTGSGTLYPGLIPNVGDAFIAQLGNGHLGQFTVTESKKMALLEESCYDISFELIREITEAVLTNIASKVVKTSFFNKDYLIYGQNPVIESNTHEELLSVDDAYADLFEDWITDFYSREYNTLIVGGQSVSTYDPFVVRSLFRIVDVNDHPVLRTLRELNCNEISSNSFTTIWDALIQRDKRHLRSAIKQVLSKSVRIFHPMPVLEGIRFSGIERVVCPVERGTNVDDQLNLNPLGFIGYTDWLMYAVNVPQDLALTSVNPTYVFSQAFYDKDMANASPFERMVMKYILNEGFSPGDILPFTEAYYDWTPVQKFYHGLVLLMLLKAVKRST